MPDKCHFGTHVGGLAEKERNLSFLELKEGKPPLSKVKEGEEEAEERIITRLT